MNKVKFKKMLEALKQGRDLKQLFDKESAKEFAIEMALRHVLIAIAPILGKILIVCLVVGALCATFVLVFQQLSGLFSDYTEAWGYLWSGTASQVSDEEISVLYYNMIKNGLSIADLGAVGEHNFISDKNKSFIDYPELHKEAEDALNKDNTRDLYSLQYYLDLVESHPEYIKTVKVNKTKLDYAQSDEQDEVLNDKIEMVNLLDKDGNPVKETVEEAAARMLSEKLVIEKSAILNLEGYEGLNKLDSTQGIGLYLKRYLLAQQQTFSQYDAGTFEDTGYKGAIYIDGGQQDLSEGDPSIFTSYSKTLSTFYPVYGLVNELIADIPQLERDENGEFYVRIEADVSKIDTLKVDKDFVSIHKETLDFPVTEHIDEFAMPWQYPFAFHQHTLCPDVGYEVALMAHKYHSLYLQVRNTESGVLKVYDVNGNKVMSDEVLKKPEIFVRRTSTWYETRDYDYPNYKESSWHGVAQGHATNYDEVQAANRFTPDSEFVNKTAIEIETITTTINRYGHDCDSDSSESEYETKKVRAVSVDTEQTENYSDPTERETHEHTYRDWIPATKDAEGNIAEPGHWSEPKTCHYTVTTDVKHEFEKLIIVECTYEYEKNPSVLLSDTKATSDDVSLTGIEAMTELLLPDPAIDYKTKTITNADEAPKYYRANDLSIKTDLDESGKPKEDSSYTKSYLNISTSAESIIKSLYDLYSGDLSEYTMQAQDYEQLKMEFEKEDGFSATSSVQEYMSLENNYRPVIELIQFFAANGVIDSSSVIGLSKANSFTIMADWFVSGGETAITSSGNIATIMTGNGRTITAPVDGTIVLMEDEGFVCIETAKLGTVYLKGVQLDSSIVAGQRVAKGQVIGTTVGNVTYYRVDDAGQEVSNPVNELKQLQAIYFSDYAWPVPDSSNITSQFGSRTDPITGKVSSHHNGLDIGAAQGTPIVAYMAGEIVKAAYDPDGYGYYITIKHSDNCYTLYGHMSAFAKRSGAVEKGEVIGYVGSTGRSTGPHLHFEYRNGPKYSDAINPMLKLTNYRELVK